MLKVDETGLKNVKGLCKTFTFTLIYIYKKNFDLKKSVCQKLKRIWFLVYIVIAHEIRKKFFLSKSIE